MNNILIKNMDMPKGGYRTVEIGIDADGHPMAIGDDRNVYDVISISADVIYRIVQFAMAFLAGLMSIQTSAPTAGLT